MIKIWKIQPLNSNPNGNARVTLSEKDAMRAALEGHSVSVADATAWKEVELKLITH